MDLTIPQKELNSVLKFCREHLNGTWKGVSEYDININRLTGGMSNLLYRCCLSDHLKSNGDEPKQVLLRLYGPSYCDVEVQLEIFNLLASERLGPILYSHFDEGRLEEYLPSNPLTWEELTSDDVSAVVAKKIAAIHLLDVTSLDQRASWLLDKFRGYNEFLKDSGEPIFNEATLDSTKATALDLIKVDFEREIVYMEELFRKTKAPLVFSHNDLHQNNILLLQNPDNDLSLDDRIVLIDFEYCSYNYRTFDAANHLSEWCFDYNADKYPYFSASLDRFPSEERQKTFLNHYIKRLRESSTSNGNDHGTSEEVEVLYKEMQPFMMASNLLWTLWAIKSAYTSKINFGYWVSSLIKMKIHSLHRSKMTNLEIQGNGLMEMENISIL